jgi:hypothetical protein
VPQPDQLAKAELLPITWEGDQARVLDREQRLIVQFNPETLKVVFSNQTSGGDQRGGSATQFTARGSTKLSFDLWFDVTAPQPDQSEFRDVRELTKKVVFFMKPHDGNDNAPPGVRFLWGSFLFEGVMESVNENLEYFSEDGRPLRAQASVTLAQQEIQIRIHAQGTPGAGGTPPVGTQPQRPAAEGETLQGIAGSLGQQDQWQQLANRIDVENPRRLPMGFNIPLR